MTKKITITMTWERLAGMDDNGMALYATPGANEPYWNSQPSFMYDECVARPSDFESYGIGYSRDDEGCEDIFSVEVELPEPRQ